MLVLRQFLKVQKYSISDPSRLKYVVAKQSILVKVTLYDYVTV